VINSIHVEEHRGTKIAINQNVVSVNKTTAPFPISEPPSSKTYPGLENSDFLVAIIPSICGMLFIAAIGVIIFVFMARKKRSLHGTYSPQNEEFKAPIIEMTDILKVPDERFKERLI